jgi:uncharacterized protein DUF3800
MELLLSLDITLHVCAIDMACQTAAEVESHKTDQCRRLTANLTDQHQPSLVEQVWDLRCKLEDLAPQQYVQFVLMTELVCRQLRDTTIYYSFERPDALGEFRWVLDAKGPRTTTYESLWLSLVGGFLQMRPYRERNSGIIQISGGDYSHFEKFCDVLDEWPSHLPPPVKQRKRGERIPIIELGRIMSESVSLDDSQGSPGLQAADICVNAFRRAMMGNLQEAGWHALGGLLMRWDHPSIQMIKLATDDLTLNEPITDSYSDVLKRLEVGSRFVLPDRINPGTDHGSLYS